MALVLDVSLLSGRKVCLESDMNDSVASLKERAQEALGVGKGRLLNSCGDVRDVNATLEAVGLQSGDHLTLHIGKLQIRGGKNRGFAAILGDASVVTWGKASCGGDSHAVQEQLRNVHQIEATCSAFAAILG